MTFKTIQDRVMARTNLSWIRARDAVKGFINERYHRLQTSIGLGRVRRGTVEFPTVVSTATYTPSSLVKPIQISYPDGNRVLGERTENELREIDPNFSQTGAPELYAVQ